MFWEFAFFVLFFPNIFITNEHRQNIQMLIEPNNKNTFKE